MGGEQQSLFIIQSMKSETSATQQCNDEKAFVDLKCAFGVFPTIFLDEIYILYKILGTLHEYKLLTYFFWNFFLCSDGNI